MGDRSRSVPHPNQYVVSGMRNAGRKAVGHHEVVRCRLEVWLECRIMGTGEEREKDEFREPGRTGLGRALNAR